MKLPLLSRLDKTFSARFRHPELKTLVADTAVEKLFTKGVLSIISRTDVVACPFGQHEGDGLVPIAKIADGSFIGFCDEHLRKVKVSAEDAEWITFDGMAWAQAIRDKNAIVLDEPAASNTGFLFVGTFRTNNRVVGLVLVAPQEQVSPLDFKPAKTEVGAIIYVLLGDAKYTKSDDPMHIPACKAFKQDLLTLNKDAIGTALSTLRGNPSEMAYLKYTGESKKPTEISIDDYHGAISPSEVKKYDLVVDMAGVRAWRNGKQVTHMVQTKARNRHGRLSRTGLRLLASYMRRPNTPLSPYVMDPYRGREDSRNKKSPQVMLLNIRKTLNLTTVWVQTDNPTGMVGDGLYAFNATDFSYLLITSSDLP